MLTVHRSSKSLVANLALAILATPFLAGAQVYNDPEVQRLLQEIPADRVEEILTPEMLERKAAYPPDLPKELMDKLIHKTRSIMSFKEYFAERGELTASGCAPQGQRDLELEFAPANLQQISLEELVERAEIAVLIEVVSNETFFRYPRYYSRITGRIQEAWHPAPAHWNTGDEVTYLSSAYDITIGPERLCAARKGIDSPRSGEILLLVGKIGDDHQQQLVVTNFFRADTEHVLPAPYSFLSQAGLSKIENLKRRRIEASITAEEENV